MCILFHKSFSVFDFQLKIFDTVPIHQMKGDKEIFCVRKRQKPPNEVFLNNTPVSVTAYTVSTTEKARTAT